MLYVKKNAKNQMLIYNKSKQVSGTNLQNQASASMLSGNPGAASSTAPGNAAAISNNFVKSS